jgi:hypothetical protein
MCLARCQVVVKVVKHDRATAPVAAKENSIEVNDPSPAMNFKITRVL